MSRTRMLVSSTVVMLLLSPAYFLQAHRLSVSSVVLQAVRSDSKQQSHKKQSAAEQTTLPKIPVVPEPSPSNGEKGSHVSDEKTASEKWLAYFTGALVVVGVLQFIAMLRHEHWMKKNVLVAQKSADAAATIGATLKDTAIRQLRAYLSPNFAQRVQVSPGVYKVKVEVQNSGQTPAHDYVAFIGVGVFGLGAAPANLTLPPGIELSRGTLGAGHKLELGGIQAPLSPQQESAILAGTEAIYVYGEIKYRDVFSIQRLTKFRLFCTGEWFDKGRFASCPDGNEAD